MNSINAKSANLGFLPFVKSVTILNRTNIEMKIGFVSEKLEIYGEMKDARMILYINLNVICDVEFMIF